MTRLLFLLLATACLSACGEPQITRGSSGMSGTVVSTGTAQLGGPYNLINQDGEAVTEKDYLGQPQLIYFGFGYCPDICPTALQKMGAVQEQIDPTASKLTYLFITIDPERDTAESLKLYTTANGFPEGLIGLTGSQAQVDVATSAYRVYAQKAVDPASAGEYTMDHSDIIYLMDEEGAFVDLFTGRSSVDEIAARIKRLLKSGK